MHVFFSVNHWILPSHESNPAWILFHFQEGLRTLCVAYRPLSPEQYEEVCHLLSGAKLALQDRDKRLAEAYYLIEKDLILLGATAVEDRWRISFKRTISLYRNSVFAFGLPLRTLLSTSAWFCECPSFKRDKLSKGKWRFCSPVAHSLLRRA